eukprot:jgi/Ulvmu1/1483/UM011_0213.1
MGMTAGRGKAAAYRHAGACSKAEVCGALAGVGQDDASCWDACRQRSTHLGRRGGIKSAAEVRQRSDNAAVRITLNRVMRLDAWHGLTECLHYRWLWCTHVRIHVPLQS